MKLNAFTKEVTHSAMTATPAARSADGRLRWLSSAMAAARLARPCSASRYLTDSPVRSSMSPITLNAATAIMKAMATGPRMSSAARTSPTAIGAPPPRSVGTVWEERRLGTSIAAARRSSEIVTGSARTTTLPQDTAATRIVNSSVTSRILARFY